MKKTFRQQQEEISKRILQEAERSTYFAKHFKKYTRQRTRIMEAMNTDSYGQVMRDCFAGEGPACGSIFCDKCLDKRQRSITATYLNYFDEELETDEGLARNRFRWITVLHSLVKVNVRTSVEEQDTIDACVAAANNLKKQLRNLSRGADGIWLRGAIHAELIDYSLFEYFVITGKGTAKERTLSAFIEANQMKWDAGAFDNNDKQLCFLIHFHALADIRDYSDDDFRKLFLKRWNLTHRQIDISRLWKEIDTKQGTIKHRIEDALKGTARYCYSRSNARLDFSRNWGAGEVVHTTGERRDTKGAVYAYADAMKDRNLDEDSSLSVGEVRLLVKVHNAIGGDAHEGLNVSIHRKR